MLHNAQFLRADSSHPWWQRLGYRALTPLMARCSAEVLTVSALSGQELRRGGALVMPSRIMLYTGPFE